jgi:hypothetical protein
MDLATAEARAIVPSAVSLRITSTTGVHAPARRRRTASIDRPRDTRVTEGGSWAVVADEVKRFIVPAQEILTRIWCAPLIPDMPGYAASRV